MQLRYGSFSFDTDSCEVTMQIDTLTNERGLPYSQTRQISANGYISGDNTAAIDAKCLLLEAALRVPYRDLILYTSEGAATHVALYNTGSTTGVVPSGPRYSSGKGAELVTYRRFEFSARAEYPIGTGRGVLQSFRESVSIIGTGGARFILKPALRGAPQKQYVQQQTVVRATQSGQAVGYLEYPTPPNPLWPADEHVEQRNVSRTGGKYRGKIWQDFTVSWSYTFESAGPLGGLPALR